MALVTTVFLTALALLNARGISESTRAKVVATVIEICGLLLVIGLSTWIVLRGDGDTEGLTDLGTSRDRRPGHRGRGVRPGRRSRIRGRADGNADGIERTTARSRPGGDGGQGQAARVPCADGTLVKLPVGEDSGLLPDLLTLSDILCTGYHAARTADVRRGDSVTVVGDGDGAVGLEDIADGYRAMNDREALKVLVRP